MLRLAMDQGLPPTPYQSPPSTTLGPTKPALNKRQRLIPRETYPPGKESTLYRHLEIGSASVESLIKFNQRVGDSAPSTSTTTTSPTTPSPDQDNNNSSNASAPLNRNTPSAPTDPQQQHVLHPSFVQLGMDYATGQIIGTFRRCHAFLEALSAFLADFKPVEGELLLSNYLISYINSVVSYLNDCRAVPLPFDNIISKCQDIIDQSSRLFDSGLERECISYIRERINEYIDELKFQQAETVNSAQKHLKDGDVVLAFGHSESVVNTLLEAQQRGLVIKVIVVDSKPLLEGKKLLHTLTLNRFECDYALITSLQYLMPQVSKVLLGAHAVLSNGALLARSGNALVALCAHKANKPVLVCCESFKFVKQAYLDGICHNELGSPSSILLSQQQQKQSQEGVFTTLLVQTSNNIEEGLEGPSNTRNVLHQTTAGAHNERALTNWTNLPNLKLLNLRFDLTPPNYISALITNYDTIPPSSASVVVRESQKKKEKTQKDDGKTTMIGF